MLPTIGPTTGPNTAPMPHITMAAGCRWRGKVASRIAWPSGMMGAPKQPWAMRAKIKVSRLPARPHSRDDTVKPSTVKNIRLRQPSRLDSQPVIGVATAVATRLSVITHEISSCVAERLPRICGSTRLASVMVMPNSMLASCTINRMSHCRPLIEKRPPFSAMAVIAGSHAYPGDQNVANVAAATVAATAAPTGRRLILFLPPAFGSCGPCYHDILRDRACPGYCGTALVDLATRTAIFPPHGVGGPGGRWRCPLRGCAGGAIFAVLEQELTR